MRGRVLLDGRGLLLIASLVLVILFLGAPQTGVAGTLFKEFHTPRQSTFPWGITAGPDGNLWFTESDQVGNIGRITPTGMITEFPVPTPSSFPNGITAGPDGNLWFVEHAGNKIGRITTSGAVTEYPLPRVA